MKKNIIILFSVFIFCSTDGQQMGSKQVLITWSDSLPGDYSFSGKWSYGENVFTNNFLQLVCDYDCPSEIRRMEDSSGRIYDSLIHEYYKLLDTTHYFHTLECEAWCYEFGEADYVDVIRNGSRVNVASRLNAGTDCSLRLNIENNVCTPAIKLISIVGPGDNIFYYHCTVGYIKIDKPSWQRGIMKAEFDLTFFHPENPKQKMYWKGKIYSKINTATGR